MSVRERVLKGYNRIIEDKGEFVFYSGRFDINSLENCVIGQNYPELDFHDVLFHLFKNFSDEILREGDLFRLAVEHGFDFGENFEILNLQEEWLIFMKDKNV